VTTNYDEKTVTNFLPHQITYHAHAHFDRLGEVIPWAQTAVPTLPKPRNATQRNATQKILGANENAP
jgi:hypothetical protein